MEISTSQHNKIGNQLSVAFAIYGSLVLFNIGGFFTSFFAINLFYIIVPVSILLSFLVKRYSDHLQNSPEFKVYWFFLFSYLFVSIISFYVINPFSNYDIIYSLRTLFYSLINVYIFYKFAVIFQYFQKLDRFLVLNVVVLLLAMMLTSIFPYFNLVPLDYEKASDSLMTLAHSYNIRLTGYYLNPNLTGYIANVSLVFAMTYFMKNRKFNLLSILLIVLSIYISVRSFSKTSIIISIILLLLFFVFLIFYRKFWLSKEFAYRRITFFIFLFAIIYLFFQSSKWYSSLDEGQKQRIDQVFSILYEQEINEKTTTHRNEIWETGILKIKHSPVIGNGYGSFDYFPEEGQGIHNMFLKIFGEAGLLIGFFYFIFHLFLFRLAYNEKRYHYRFMLLALITITIIFNISNHNAFHTSIISYVYGFILSFGVQYRLS